MGAINGILMGVYAVVNDPLLYDSYKRPPLIG